MSKIHFLIASFSSLAICISSSFAQDCYQGGSDFGYPSTSSYGGFGGHHQARKERREEWKQEAEKIRARNDAWPKPFACHDRMAYFAVWDPMINQGYASHCILSQDHFQPENNELNEAGKRKIASIMQNLPTERRQLWIVRDPTSSISQARLENVNEIVQTFYGQSALHTTIAFTDRQPATISGGQADAISKRQLEGMPVPVIPIVSSGQGISSSTSQ
jgi:hypothetical protein